MSQTPKLTYFDSCLRFKDKRFHAFLLKNSVLLQGMVGALALAVAVLARQWLEASMWRHMVLQFPLLLLAGAAGSGKSSLIRQVAAKLNYPVFEITAHGRLEFADLAGHLSLDRGSMRFQHGPLALAMRRPRTSSSSVHGVKAMPSTVTWRPSALLACCSTWGLSTSGRPCQASRTSRPRPAAVLAKVGASRWPQAGSVGEVMGVSKSGCGCVRGMASVGTLACAGVVFWR
jgi:hypothetical protein